MCIWALTTHKYVYTRCECVHLCGHKSKLPPIVGQSRITVGFNIPGTGSSVQRKIILKRIIYIQFQIRY